MFVDSCMCPDQELNYNIGVWGWCSNLLSYPALEPEGSFLFFFLRLFIYLFLERGEGQEKEGERHQCLVASHTPHTREPGPRLGTELATLWFTGQRSIHWATPAGAGIACFKNSCDTLVAKHSHSKVSPMPSSCGVQLRRVCKAGRLYLVYFIITYVILTQGYT